jgi:hypothetical protein
MLKARYASYDAGKGKEFEEGKLTSKMCMLMQKPMANQSKSAENRSFTKQL